MLREAARPCQRPAILQLADDAAPRAKLQGPVAEGDPASEVWPTVEHQQGGELGGEVSHTKSGRMHVVLKGHSANFPVPHHTFPKAEVMQIRKFLETCGVDADRDYPL